MHLLGPKGNLYVRLTDPDISLLLKEQRPSGRAILKCPVYSLHRLPDGALQARIFTYPGRILNQGQLEWISERISRGDELYIPRKNAVQSGYKFPDIIPNLVYS